jgi:hypothetical protein
MLKSFFRTALLICAVSIFTTNSFAAGQPTKSQLDRYAAIKAIGTKLAKQQLLLDSDASPTAENIELYPCSGWSEELDTDRFSDRTTRQLLDVAGYITGWEQTLLKAGFPPSAWKDKLSAAEQSLLKKALSRRYGDTAFMDNAIRDGRAVAAAARAYRTKHNPTLPTILYQGECGAGGPVNVTLKSAPSSGTIHIISEFQYELCKAEGAGTGIGACSGWRTVKSNGLESVSGRYYIVVTWSDKSGSPRIYDFSNVNPGDVFTVGQQ